MYRSHPSPKRVSFTRFLLVFSLVISLVLSACGGEEARPPLEPAEIHWISFNTNNQAEGTLIEKYQEQNPQITVKRDGRFRGGFFGGFLPDPAPDLLSATADFDYLQAIGQDQLADLSELWEQAGLTDNIPANVRSLVEIDGKSFMTPLAINWTAVYYNTAVFAQAGLQPPKTWDEFINVCEQLIVQGEVPIVITGNRSYSFMLWFDLLNLRLNGAQFHRELLDGKVRFDDRRVVEVLERWKLLFERGYFVEHPEYLSDLEASNSLIRDDKGMLRGPKAAMMLLDARTAAEMPAKFRQELDFFPFPTLDPAIPAAESATVLGYVIPRAADHNAQAIDLLGYLNTPEAQSLLFVPNASASVAYVPARSDFDGENLPPQVARAMDHLHSTPQLAPQAYIWLPRTVREGFNTGYTHFLRKQEYDVSIFVEDLQKAQDAAKQNGAYQE